MICNKQVTVYHNNGLDLTTHFETWTRHNYDNVWLFYEKNSSTNKGYDDDNNFDCRIPYESNPGLDVSNFCEGDIVVEGNLTQDIETQQDLQNCLVFNITSIKNNDFGNNQHIHISGK